MYPRDLSYFSQVSNSSSWCCDIPQIGLVCDNAGRIIEMNSIPFPDFLVGPLPPALGKLTALKSLEIWGNNLVGGLDVLSTLTALTFLDLLQNVDLGGSLQPLATLTSLQYLNLSATCVNGTLAPLVGLTCLVVLNLSYPTYLLRALTGDLSPLVAMTSLQRLDLSVQNMLTGTLDSLSQLTQLNYLAISYSSLFGTLDAASRWTTMTHLDLGTNKLTGSLQPLAFLPLTHLDVNSNHLSGDLATVSNFVSLTYFDGRSNQFTGI